MTNRLRILALSDLHGRCFREASDLIDDTHPDWIVLCGDILPDFGMISGKGNRLEAQREFWAVYRSCFIRDFAKTTLVRGNHEIEGFADPALRLLPGCIDDHVIRLEGIPVEFGGWGWSREWEEDELRQELHDQYWLVPEPRIYISHVPPYGCLDLTADGQRIGHRALRRHLEKRKWPQALVLCGHVHESFGHSERGKTTIVNAACGYALIEWSSEGLNILSMDRLKTRPRDAEQ